MKLDEKGRCCGRKPIPYKRPWKHKFCDRCDRSYDTETGYQIENWAWNTDRTGIFRKTNWRGKAGERLMGRLDARVMPFGEHKGERVDSIVAFDPSYLRWVLEDIDLSHWPGLYTHIREALARRGELNE